MGDDVEKKHMDTAYEKEERSDSQSSNITTSSHDDGIEDADRSSSEQPNEKRPSTELRPKISRASSVRNPIVIVPRKERRGWLAHLALIPEVTVPTDYSNRTKWLITAIVAVSAAAAPMGSAIILPALTPIAVALDTSPTITNLSVAMYMLSMSIFPLWWSSFSESLGRRTIYIISFALFVLWGVLSALAQNIAMLIVMRVLSGGAAASVQAVGAGTIADVWEPGERGRAMGIFYLGPLCGPLLAPIIGGAMSETLGWRSSLWFLVGYGVLLEIFLVFCLPETLKKRKDIVAEAQQEAVAETAHVEDEEELSTTEERKASSTNEQPNTSSRPQLERTTTRHSIQVKTRKWLSILRRCFVDPLKIILLLRFPAVAITVYYAAITFGALYFLNISIEDTFSKAPYNFSTLIVGLLYIPNSLGYFIASILGGRWIDYIMKREAVKAGRYDPNTGKLIFIPEDRMKENAWLAAFVFPAALIWYGWTAEFHVHWIVPIIANFFFGLGSMIIFAMATTMLTEFLPGRASMGIAVNNFVRNIFSCVGGIIAAPLISAIGNGWLCTILGLVSLISGIGVIFSMKRFGPAWRVKMEKEIEGWS